MEKQTPKVYTTSNKTDFNTLAGHLLEMDVKAFLNTGYNAIFVKPSEDDDVFGKIDGFIKDCGLLFSVGSVNDCEGLEYTVTKLCGRISELESRIENDGKVMEGLTRDVRLYKTWYDDEKKESARVKGIAQALKVLVDSVCTESTTF